MSAAAPNRYGKHGKWVRWRIITLHYDRAWDCAEVHGHLNSGGDDDVSLRTVYRVIEIFDSTGDVATPSGGIRVVDGSVSADQWEFKVRVETSLEISIRVSEIEISIENSSFVTFPTSIFAKLARNCCTLIVLTITVCSELTSVDNYKYK